MYIPSQSKKPVGSNEIIIKLLNTLRSRRLVDLTAETFCQNPSSCKYCRKPHCTFAS